ncbi:MAG: hypothetical protein ACP5HJ_02620 [Candidatus Micrarchaeia archaeon]
MNKKIILISFLTLILVVGLFLFLKTVEETKIYVKIFPSKNEVYPFERINISIEVESSRALKDVLVSLESKNSTIVSVLFPSIKQKSNSSVSFYLNETGELEIKAIPDSIYLYSNARRISDSIKIRVLEPNMSFYQIPEYKKFEILNLNKKGLRAMHYLTTNPIFLLWQYINFTHIENIYKENETSPSFTNIYLQSFLTPKDFADFFSLRYGINYSKINDTYFFKTKNSSVCVLYKQGFTRIIESKDKNCLEYLNIPSNKPIQNVTLQNLSFVNSSQYIGNIKTQDYDCKGFSYRDGYYLVCKYKDYLNCTQPTIIANQSFCISSSLVNMQSYQFKIINVTSRNFGFYFFNFNSSVENEIINFAIEKIIQLTNPLLNKKY